MRRWNAVLVFIYADAFDSFYIARRTMEALTIAKEQALVAKEAAENALSTSDPSGVQLGSWGRRAVELPVRLEMRANPL